VPLNNRWNRFIYWLWSPAYDVLFSRLFLSGRCLGLELLALQPGERVLILGVGTGLDFPLLPEGVFALGVDLSPAMLRQARSWLPLPGREVSLVQADAQCLLTAHGSFDAVIFNLILSVVPDGKACFAAGMQALAPHGRAVIFDKFLPESVDVSFRRKILNKGAMLLGTDINRRLGEILSGYECRVLVDEPSLLGGTYRVILVEK
jgi:phosphatidylethanolamine/phosphatidyl-N-methylethanolamine N-methyltransferase